MTECLCCFAYRVSTVDNEDASLLPCAASADNSLSICLGHHISVDREQGVQDIRHRYSCPGNQVGQETLAQDQDALLFIEALVEGSAGRKNVEACHSSVQGLLTTQLSGRPQPPLRTGPRTQSH